MPLRFARIAVPIFLLSAPAGARETRQLTAVRVAPERSRSMAHWTTRGWAGVAFTAGFLQNRPVDGAAPSQPTEVLAEWERSGKTLEAFARSRGWGPQRLAWWSARERYRASLRPYYEAGSGRPRSFRPDGSNALNC